MSLAGKAAIVTGSSGGIGGAIAAALAADGVSVTLTGRRIEALNDLGKRLNSSGHQVHIATCDLRSEEEIRALFRDAHKRWGRLDILVNSAAVGADAPLSRGDGSESWREMVMVNIVAAASASREAMRYFDAAQGGHIINIGSTSAYRVRPESGFYAATKFALRAMTEALRMELAHMKSRTRVTLVSPGRVATGFFHDSRPQPIEPPDELLRPDDVAGVVLSVLQTAGNGFVNEVIIRPRSQTL
jgi:NADP-dependent 3-hydroxy acid dehydrogenase YdfG